MRISSYAKKNWIKFFIVFVFLSYVVHFNRLTIKYMYDNVTVSGILKQKREAIKEIEVTDNHVIKKDVADIMKPTFVPDNDRVSTKGFLTIGIPTVQRKGAVYIFSTLESLVNNSRPKTKHAWEVKIVILFADTNKTYNDELAKNITIVYHDLIDQKVMHLVTIPGNYYPDLDHLKITYNDSTVRVKWRSKQNLDYAYLMAYSANLSQYYLQLEDDLLTREGYLDNIKEFIKEHKKHDWAMLDFNESGFIGKLYHSPDIVKLATVLKSFFNEKPCDYLISDFLKLMLQQKRYYYKPKLFRHLGLHSSLSINKRVTDHHFKR